MATTNSERVTKYERSLSIPTSDGTILSGKIFEPAVDAHTNVLIIGAVGVPQHFYQRFARALRDQGYRVVTFDYRGIGASKPRSLRDFQATLTDWLGNDYPTALDFLLNHHGSAPTCAVGHSFGGQIVALAPRAKELQAVATVASQSGYYQTFDNPGRLGLMWRFLVPSLTSVYGYLPGFAGTGESLPLGVAREWASWCLSPDYYFSEHPEYRDRLTEFDRDILAYSFSDDAYGPLANVHWLQAQHHSALVEHRHLAPAAIGQTRIGHFGFFRPDASALWQDVMDFFQRPRPKKVRPPRAAFDSTAWRKLRVSAPSDREVLADLAFGRP